MAAHEGQPRSGQPGLHRQAPLRRVVVKVGSAVIVREGRLDRTQIDRLAAEVSGLRRRGVEVVIVSSGAVAGGLAGLGMEGAPRRILDKQAAAAIGQQRLMRAWGDALSEAGGHTTGQVLLTADDLEDRTRYLNARHTLERLLLAGAVPVVNENDSVSFDELRLGDNDRLSALVAAALDADLLLMLSTVQGLQDRDGEVVREVADIARVRELVRADTSGPGTGGMATKLDAAQIATSNGVACVIAGGARARAITDAADGADVGTRFVVRASGPSARKAWIAYSAKVRGVVVIDTGAIEAIKQRGASLLPKGIVDVHGDFPMGAVVELRGPSGDPIARGLACYASEDLRRIRGKRAGEIESTLGFSYADAAVHRDDLTLVEPEGAPS